MKSKYQFFFFFFLLLLLLLFISIIIIYFHILFRSECRNRLFLSPLEIIYSTLTPVFFLPSFFFYLLFFFSLSFLSSISFPSTLSQCLLFFHNTLQTQSTRCRSTHPSSVLALRAPRWNTWNPSKTPKASTSA